MAYAAERAINETYGIRGMVMVRSMRGLEPVPLDAPAQTGAARQPAPEAAGGGLMKFQATLRMIWGLAKSPELSMSSEELHMFVEARTGKESLEGTDTEGAEYGRPCIDGAETGSTKGADREPSNSAKRQKLKELASEAGWDNPARLNGLARKMFGVECVEWLNGAQCSKLIEAMKAMNKRKVEEDAEGLALLLAAAPDGSAADGSKGSGSADGSADQELTETAGAEYNICPELLQAIAWREKQLYPGRRQRELQGADAGKQPVAYGQDGGTGRDRPA